MALSRLTQFAANVAFGLKRSIGILERQSPATSWSSVALAANAESEFLHKWKSKSPNLPIALLDRTFLAPHLEQYAVALGHSPEAEAKAIASGRFRTSDNEFISLGVPPEWNRGQQSQTSAHWTKVILNSNAEAVAASSASQFNWAYTLVRAWLLTGSDTYAELFWNYFEDWIEKNPPNRGPQWLGDEAIAQRLIAVIFATQALRFHSATTDARILKVARFVSASATRLHLSHQYICTRSALIGLTSALALFSAGALWSQLPEADIWRSHGLEHLINEGKGLITDDGRLNSINSKSAGKVLEILALTEIILRCENERESLPESLHRKIRALIVLSASQASADRTTPNLFSLSGCYGGDIRPAIAAAQILFTGTHFNAGPWDEETLLLVGPLCDSVVIV